MTKQQLQDKVEELQSKIEELENDVDYWCNYSNELEEQKEELEEQVDNLQFEKENTIQDVDSFKFKLKIDNLLSSELETFINNYIRYEIGDDD